MLTMSLSDEIRNLQELRDSGVLTEEEFARAKATVLSSPSPPASGDDQAALQHHLQQIQRQNELDRLDREWEMEREQYLIADKYGARHVPTEGGSLVGAIVIGGFGLFWTITAASMGAPVFFPIFGILFIILGVGASLRGYGKAGEYRQAHQRYEQRRFALLTQANSAQRRSGAVEPVEKGK